MNFRSRRPESGFWLQFELPGRKSGCRVMREIRPRDPMAFSIPSAANAFLTVEHTENDRRERCGKASLRDRRHEIAGIVLNHIESVPLRPH